MEIGAYELLDMQRSVCLIIHDLRVFISFTTCIEYFQRLPNRTLHHGIFADMAIMWSKLSRDSVMPGMCMCDQLSMMSDQRENLNDLKCKAKNCSDGWEMLRRGSRRLLWM